MLHKRGGLSVDAVIDVNPAKQGKFLPATGLEVLSPEIAIAKLPNDAVIIVMNSNYLAEIKQITGNAFNYIAVDQL